MYIYLHWSPSSTGKAGMSERDAEGGIIVKAPATTNAGILHRTRQVNATWLYGGGCWGGLRSPQISVAPAFSLYVCNRYSQGDEKNHRFYKMSIIGGSESIHWFWVYQSFILCWAPIKEEWCCPWNALVVFICLYIFSTIKIILDSYRILVWWCLLYFYGLSYCWVPI